LNHPNLVSIFDIGEFEGRQFIAQEWIPGKTLRDTLAAGPISVKSATDIAAQIAAGLAAAHVAGVVHRDIKPENIIVRPDGIVKVVDFGIARLMEQGSVDKLKNDSEITRPGMILGTARYMSPEQARGMQVDGRSDIFSLGVVIYEMLAGSSPFTGGTPSDVLAAILTVDPPPIPRNSRDRPAEIERIVRRCLSKDPAARYSSAADLRLDLERMAASPKGPSQTMLWVATVSTAIVFVAVSMALIMRLHERARRQYSSMHMTRLATRAEVSDVAISRDGRLLAYVATQGPGANLWTREFSGTNERISVTERSGELSGITFSPDDTYIYYRRKGSDGTSDLFRVPVKGGAPERIVGDISSAPGLSPDGKQVAFIRLKPTSWEASLMVSNADGSGEFTLRTVHRPQFFDENGVAWSPDGQAIAFFAGEYSGYSDAAFRLVEVNLRHPGQRVISQQLWRPRGVTWASKGDVLIVTALTPADVGQLWMVRHDDGEAIRLTNDFSNYGRASMTDDGQSLVTAQSESSVSIWVAAGNESSHFNRVGGPTFSSPRVAISWTPDGGIVYNDPADGFRNLWRMDADGTNPRSLTTSPANKDEVVVTRDGRYMVYQQGPHIWRVTIDGTQPRELTTGRLDVHPAVSPDGKTVVYTSFADWTPGIGGEPSLWRVSIDGKDASQIATQPASIPSVSPDGRQVACIHFPGKDPRISSTHLAVLNIDSKGGFTIYEPSSLEDTTLSWSPDGKGLDYVLNINGLGNIWRQPLKGGPPLQITHFDRDNLIHFAWSREGRLACTRGSTIRSAVLIQDFR
jgi:Tol biopolymer transport system component